MAANTAIEWTDTTWNPVVGCSIVSPGCHNCYALRMSNRLRAMAEHDQDEGRDAGRTRHYIDAVTRWGKWTGNTVPVPESLTDPFAWKKPRRVFVNSMSDLFHESLPFAYIDRVFATMGVCRRHTFQVLTKRADRLAEYFDEDIEELWHRWAVAAGDLLDGDWIWRSGKPHRPAIERFMTVGFAEALDDDNPLSREELDAVDHPLPNVWIGVSVEDAKRTSRITALRSVPAAVRFLSCEPLLGDLGQLDLTGIGWVIAGGESGPNARPMHLHWVQSLRDQCIAATVPFFFKQWGEWQDGSNFHRSPCGTLLNNGRFVFPDGRDERAAVQRELMGWSEFEPRAVAKVGKVASGRLLDGREWNEFPALKTCKPRHLR